MNQLCAVDVAQQGFDVLSAVPSDAAGFGTRVVDKAAGDLAAFRRATAHGGTALELAIDSLDTHREQAAAIGQRAHRTGIQDKRPRELEMIGQPLLACRQRRFRGVEQGADASPRAADSSESSTRPLTISVCAPLRAARWAARTLVIMPPLLMPLPAPPAMVSKLRSSARPSADQLG
jgi:hypothetical protein